MEYEKSGMTTQDIGPCDAKKLIEASIGNRPIKHGKVLGYASDMRRGFWRCEPGIEPIQISKDGKLMNGHHRLMAVIEYGGPVQFRVEFGVSADVMDFIDRNAPRSVGDIMAISYGWTSSRVRVAIINAIHRYGSGGRQPWRSLTISETVKLGDIYQESMNEVGHCHKGIISAAMVAVFVRARRHGEPIDGIKTFIDAVKSGVPSPGWESSGALLLARFILERSRRNTHGGSAGTQVTAMTERALRSHLDGDRMRLLRPYKNRIWATPETERIV